MAASPLASKTSATIQAGIRGLWWKVGTGFWLSLTILAAFLLAGPAVGFPYPEGARIIFFHVPCAWLSCLAYLVAAWYALRFLKEIRRKGWSACAEDDYKCAAAMELGLLFSLFTTLSGSIFSHLEWGLYWNWDPRQTSILIILLIFAAYLVLRGAVSEPEKRGRLASVYALVALVPGLFLIWVLPRIVPTLHESANRAVLGGNLGGNYRLILYAFSLPSFVGLFIWLFHLRLRVMRLEARRSL